MAPNPALASDPAAAPEAPIPLSHSRLPNGLEVVVLPDHRAPVVTHMVWYRNGSADDPAGKSGIAHFLEHLMFKGTARYPEGAFSRIIAGLGGQENAFTSYDYTAYFQRVQSAHLATVMDYEADRMRGLSFDEAVVAPERDVVLEERSMRVDADPHAQLSEQMSLALNRDHPYGIPIIGWRPEIEGLTRDDAYAYYRRFYDPSNAILVVAGATDLDTVMAAAAETYGKVETGGTPLRKRPDRPLAGRAERVRVADARVHQPMMHKYLIAPSYLRDEAGDVHALEVAMAVLGEGPTSRLYRELVVQQGLAARASGNLMSSLRDGGIIYFSLVPRAGVSLAALERGMADTVARFLDEGPTEAEVASARTRLLADMLFARDDQASMARMFGGALATGESIDDVMGWSGRIRAVTRETATAAARRWLKLDEAVTGELVPANA